MMIAEFEKQVDLPRDTIRYYEKIGMISPPVRGANGYRHYGQTQVAEIKFIQKGKALGFTLPAIKQGYQRYQALGHFCPEFIQELRDKKAMFAKRIAQDTHAIAEIEKMLSSL